MQLGRYAEYFVKMEFTMYGFDVYTSEVDDKGIDFVVRRDRHRYYDVQVKSVRSLNYVFMPKDRFQLRDNMFLALVLFQEGLPPRHFLIPALAWLVPNALFVGRDYEGRRSAPEWGLNLSVKSMSLLEPYEFEHAIERFMDTQT